MAAAINIIITNSGGNIILDGTDFPLSEINIEFFANSGVVLTNNFHFEINPAPVDGTIINYLVGIQNLDLNGHTFDIDSVFFTQTLIDAHVPFSGRKFYMPSSLGGTFWQGESLFYGVLDGSQLLDNTVALSKLTNLTNGYLIIGNSSNRPTAVTQSGDVIFSNTGNSSIQPLVITNSMISNSAAIGISKLAALSPSGVVVTDGSGYLTTQSQLSTTLGGLGANNSSSTGFVKFSGGTGSVGSISETIISDVDFTNPPSGISTNKVKMSFAGTVTDIYAIVTNTIGTTDSATITPKNNAGTNMTLSAPLIFSANSAVDTALDVSVTANNTFVAGDILSFTTNKLTQGGKVKLSITVTRNS